MARPPDQLDAIAADKGSWSAFGLRLLGAMADPSAYGFSRSDEVLAEVARLRGQKPESLMNAVRATRYLIEQMPAELEKSKETPLPGLSHINLLARLDNMDTQEVRSLRLRVLGGEMSYRELAARVREIQDRVVAEVHLTVGGPNRISGRKRARSFDWTLGEFLTARIKELSGEETATIGSGRGQFPVPVDYVVWVRGEPAIAIETRAPRGNFRQSVLVEMLGVCSLLQRRVPEVWLITPHGWEVGLEKIRSIAEEMRLNGLRFFTFDEATASTGTSALQEIAGAGRMKLKDAEHPPDERSHGDGDRHSTRPRPGSRRRSRS